MTEERQTKYSNEDLIHLWFEGVPSDDETSLFRQRLGDPEFRFEFWRYATLSGILRDQSGNIFEQSILPDKLAIVQNSPETAPHILDVKDVSELYELLRKNASHSKTDSLIRLMRFHVVSSVTLLLLTFLVLTVIIGSWALHRRTDTPSHSIASVPSVDINATESPDETDPTNQAPDDISARRSSPVVAVLRNVVDVQWKNMAPMQHGDMIRPGKLSIDEGLLLIDFLSGVRLIVNGPADLTIHNETEVSVELGNFTCHVTQFGRGFKIRTPELNVIDLGTSFCMDVQANREPEIHVLEGKVLVQVANSEVPVEIVQNKALRWEKGNLANVRFQPDRFTKMEDVASLDSTSTEKKLEKWKSKCEEFHRTKSVLVHFNADDIDQSKNKLPNRAGNDRFETDGVLIGCSFGKNRWDAGKSIDFRTPIDRVLFKLPGTYEQLTFLAWVRIDGLLNKVNALIDCEEQRIWEANLPVGYRHQVSIKPPYLTGVRWEIQQQGKMQFNVCHGGEILDKHKFKWDEYITSRQVIKEEHFGQWCFLAVTYDVPNRKIVQYFNGKPVDVQNIKTLSAVPLNFMNIGNCGEPFDVEKFRLLGAIDETIILNRALTETDIATINRLSCR